MCVACALIPAVISLPFGLLGLFQTNTGHINWLTVAVIIFGLGIVFALFFEDKFFSQKKGEKETKNLFKNFFKKINQNSSPDTQQTTKTEADHLRAQK